MKKINSNRKYVIASWKHSTNGVLQFWGNLTDNSEKRSFSGYNENIDDCEKYDLEEVIGYNRYKFIETVKELDNTHEECFIVDYSFFDDSKIFKSKKIFVIRGW